MLEKYIGKYYQRSLVLPVATLCQRLKLHPNTVTFVACLSGLMIPIAIATQHLLIALILLLFSGYLDTLDGALARLRQKQSALGTVLDIICDRIVEFAIVFGLLLVDPINRAIPIALMLGSMLVCVTSFLVVGLFLENQTEKGFFYHLGLIDRPEAFAFFIAMLLFPHYFTGLAYLFFALVMLTALLRLINFAGHQRKLITRL